MKNTAGDFWRMVWEMKTAAIVMLTQIEEDGEVSKKIITILFKFLFCRSNHFSIGQVMLERRTSLEHSKLKLSLMSESYLIILLENSNYLQQIM